MTHIHEFHSQIQVIKKINTKKKQALLAIDLFPIANTCPPHLCPYDVLKLSSPSSSKPTSILQGPSNLLKIEPYKTKMARGKSPYVRSVIASNWLLSKIEKNPLHYFFQIRTLCYFERKVGNFYTNVEDVKGDMRKVSMKLKDREELCVEAHVELVRSLASVITAQEVVNLGIKLDKLLENKVDFVVVGYNFEDELKLIDDGVKDLRDQIVIVGVKVKDLKAYKIVVKNDLQCVVERLMVTKDNSNILEEVVAKYKTKYEMVSQQLRVAESRIHSIQTQLHRMKKGWGLSLNPLPFVDNLEVVENLNYNLNVCLVCGFCYKCHDHMTTPCGHTYHPLCMLQHSTGDLKC